MKRLCALVLALFFGFLGSVKAAPPDVNGWQAYTWGMTGAQIQAAPGGAVRQERWWAPQRQFYVEYEVPGITLEGKPYIARLHMDPKTERLIEVRLVDAQKATGRVPERARFDALERLLVQRYGPAQLRTDLDETRREVMPSLKLSRTWTFPATTIELSHDWFSPSPSDGLGSFTIRYFQNKNSDSSKL